MLNSICERRVRLKDKYKLHLEVPENDYLFTYDRSISVENASDILSQYLRYHQDDGRFNNVEIKHDKKHHIIKIEADLSYEGNGHTTGGFSPNYLRNEKL